MNICTRKQAKGVGCNNIEEIASVSHQHVVKDSCHCEIFTSSFTNRLMYASIVKLLLCCLQVGLVV